MDDNVTPIKLDPRCSFCGKSKGEVGRLIAGLIAFICEECIEFCMDMLRNEEKGKKSAKEEFQALANEKHLVSNKLENTVFKLSKALIKVQRD